MLWRSGWQLSAPTRASSSEAKPNHRPDFVSPFSPFPLPLLQFTQCAEWILVE